MYPSYCPSCYDPDDCDCGGDCAGGCGGACACEKDSGEGVWCRKCGDFIVDGEPDDKGDEKALCYRCFY